MIPQWLRILQELEEKSKKEAKGAGTPAASEQINGGL